MFSVTTWPCTQLLLLKALLWLAFSRCPLRLRERILCKNSVCEKEFCEREVCEGENSLSERIPCVRENSVCKRICV